MVGSPLTSNAKWCKATNWRKMETTCESMLIVHTMTETWKVAWSESSLVSFWPWSCSSLLWPCWSLLRLPAVGASLMTMTILPMPNRIPDRKWVEVEPDLPINRHRFTGFTFKSFWIFLSPFLTLLYLTDGQSSILMISLHSVWKSYPKVSFYNIERAKRATFIFNNKRYLNFRAKNWTKNLIFLARKFKYFK